jgi:hypothetical protein
VLNGLNALDALSGRVRGISRRTIATPTMPLSPTIGELE